jgi:GntR family phosphonate transport system transcriptional regulator
MWLRRGAQPEARAGDGSIMRDICAGEGRRTVTLRREAGRAIWRQIADAIAADIGGRALKPGERLPTETALAARFGVNRHTVRQALGHLQDRGVIQVEQGRGTFVARDPLVYPVGRRTRFTEIVRLQHRLPGGRLLRVRQVPAGPGAARDLEVAEGTPLQVLDVLHLADGQPLCVAAHHFVLERVGDLEPGFRAHGSITAALAGRGIADYVRRATRISARHPTSREVGLLAMPRTRPLLVAEAINTLVDGPPIELGVACFPADRVQIVLETP